MSSNEEYLDSLLKAVTTEGGVPAEDISEPGSGAASGDEQDWDGISQYDLEKMLANVENMDVPETNLEEKMPEVYSGDGDEEKAFSDPGALFFEGEEEYLDDGELEGSKAGGAVSDDGAGEKDDFSSLFFDNVEEDESENDADIEKTDEASDSGEKPERETEEAESDNKDNVLSLEKEGAGAKSDNAPESSAVVSDSEGEAMEKENATEQENTFEEEDIIAAADNTEEEPGEVKEELPTADENKEEDIIAAADSMEEDLIAAADSVEEVQKDTPLEDEGFKEINDLLASSGGDDDDMFAMLEGVGNEEEGEPSDIGIPEEEVKEKPETTESGKSKKKRKKKKTSGEETEGDDSEEGQNEKKPGIFARFINFLLEEDEEDEEEQKETESTEEGEGAALGETTDENVAILEELEKEDAEKAGKKDKKKKKGKKGKDEETSSEDDEDEEEGDSGKKAKKKKKKKEKKEKSEEVFAEPTKKISAIKIEVTVVFCLSILAAILLTVHLVPPELARKSAREAYYAKDYESVIEGFYGEELSESDNLMYQRAYTILRMQRKIEGYNDYMRMGKETEAVNQLIEGIVRYNEIYEEASKYNVTEEVDAIYDMIAEALFNKYGVTPERAKELYGMTDNFAYTLALESIIDGVEYTMPVTEEGTQSPAEEGAPETEAVVQE